MSTAKKTTTIQNRPGKAQKIPVRFDPNLNGTYRVRFEENATEAGFAALLQSGSFHAFPGGFVITNEQKSFLDNQNIPYKLVKRS